jgi:hypothetical protein
MAGVGWFISLKRLMISPSDKGVDTSLFLCFVIVSIGMEEEDFISKA